MTDKKEATYQWWDHYCPDAREILRFNKKDNCHFCNEKYASDEEKQLRNKIPVDYWIKIIGK